MVEFLASVFGTLGTAGITGPLGVVIGAFSEWGKQKKMAARKAMELEQLKEQNRHAEAMADKTRETKLVEGQLNRDIAKEGTRQASYGLELTSADNYRWVNAVRSLFRPGITLYCGVMVWINNTNTDFWQGSFGLTLGWWFGERGVALAMDKHV